MEDFVFTRYLYEKTEVKLALLVSLLKKKNDALFWAYEIYYSGFVDELIHLLWKIYYDFYATLNPCFESRLLDILNHEFALEKNEKNVFIIINEFMVRPFNTDIFILYQLMTLDLDKDYLDCLSDFEKMKKKIIEMIESDDYINISSYINEDCSENRLDDVVMLYSRHFGVDNKINMGKIKRAECQNKQSKRLLVLTNLLSNWGILKKMKLGKNISIDADEKEIECYKTCRDGEVPAYRILPHFCKFNIDAHKYLGLFHLKRDVNSANITDAYLNNWLYFASFSSIWKERIMRFNGKIDNANKNVLFEDDECLEGFHNKYNYEPDEQKRETQNRTIQTIECVRTWRSFYEDNCSNCLVDIESDCLDEINKIAY